MRRGRTLILVLLIVIIGLVVAFVALRQIITPPAEEEQTLYVDIFYAAQYIPQGGEITEDVLGTLRIPQENVVTVMYTLDEMTSLVGKMAKLPLEQGVVITEGMVTDSSAGLTVPGPQWASIIPPGMTAMAIPIDRLSVSGYAINDGAHVNVNACLLFVDVDLNFQSILPNLTAVLTGTGLGSVQGATGTGFSVDGLPILSLGVAGAGSPQGRLELEQAVQQPYYLVPSEPQRPRMVCQTILQDVVVLRLGDFPLAGAQSPAQPAPEAQPTAEGEAPPPAAPDLITLIVEPQHSITLSYLVYTNAKLSLTLRNPTDQGRLAVEASTLQFLLSQYNIPVPAKLPYAMHPALIALTTPTLPNDLPQEPQP